MRANQRPLSIVTLVIAAIGFSCAFVRCAEANPPPPAPNCPSSGFAEGLGRLLEPDAQLPTNNTANVPVPDCNFNEWGWEAFVWATALIDDPSSGATVPRFLSFATPAELLNNDKNAGSPHPRPLTLAARAQVFHGMPGFRDGAGSIVEADGNMLVAQNGYPVYASVHMNKSYFDTARKNLIATGGYTSQPAHSTFDLGAAVLKATWLRLDPNEKPPAGAYTTQAKVPVLETKITPCHYSAGVRRVRHRDGRAHRPACRRSHRQPPGICMGYLRTKIGCASDPGQHVHTVCYAQ
jgi:hypothetical protein